QTSLTAHADPASGRESRMPHPVLVLLLPGTETPRPGSVVRTRPACAVRVHISPGNERAPSVACLSPSLHALSPLEGTSVLPVAYRDNSADRLDPSLPSACPASVACLSPSLNALSPLEESSVSPVAYRDNSADGLDPFLPSVCPASAAPNNPLQLVLPRLGG